MANNRYVRLFRMKAGQLGFVSRMVYSWLAFRPKGSSAAKIALYLTFDRETVQRHLHQLAIIPLVHYKNGLWYAHQPPAAVQDWFYYAPGLQHLARWRDRIGYRKIPLPVPDAPYSVRQCAVYCLRTQKIRQIARNLGLSRTTVRTILKQLAGVTISQHYFQKAGTKMQSNSSPGSTSSTSSTTATTSAGAPQTTTTQTVVAAGAKPSPTLTKKDDYIARILKGMGVKPKNIDRLRPQLTGLTADTITKLASRAKARYDKDKYEDCSYMIAYIIKKEGIKPIPGPEPERRPTDPDDPQYWESRFKLWSEHGRENLFGFYGKERVLEAAAKVPPHYYEDQPGGNDSIRADEADAKKMSWSEFEKLLKGQ